MPPDNGSYAVIAYILAGVIYVGYALSLLVRARRLDGGGVRSAGSTDD